MSGVKYELIAKTFYGLEDVLAQELEELGANDVVKGNRLVRFTGDLTLMYRANIYLRTALRILKKIDETTIQNQDDYYQFLHGIDWEKYFNLHQSIMIDTVIHSKIFPNTHFATLRAKDAIADFFRTKYNRRPETDKDNPAIVINIHVFENKLTLSLDSSGAPLFKRGYRTATVDAPINEVLAAGLIKMSGWQSEHPFFDPMCGSGTFGIEAAMMAKQIPPGLLRRTYAFQNWNDHNKEIYNELIDGIEMSDKRFRILSNDISEKAIEIAKRNAQGANISSRIKHNVEDFFETIPPFKNKAPYVFINPPYDERLKKEDIINFYRDIGTVLKTKFSEARAFIISSNNKALKHIGLKPYMKHTVYNGALECKFCGYELFEGTYKDYKTSQSG
ncbi:MAG: THUMP domain-containing protein [Bacteroidales bacterium]|nr:THUMP domain-containing protein [Bacteroidales bacterium]